MNKLISPALIAVSTVFAYLNSLLNPFIWDDAFLIASNLHIKSLSYIPRLFLENIYHQDMIGKFYRPVLMGSFALDYNMWGLEPFGYHLTNILIHLANALMVYCLVRLVFRKEFMAFLTAMLFALHPVQTEAVTYISGRADPLAAFFCLISFYFFITYTDLGGFRRKLYFWASVFSFLLALLSKESAAIIPLAFICYDVFFRKEGLKGRKGAAKYALFLVIISAYAVARHFILIGVKSATTVGTGFPLWERLSLVPQIIVTYMRLLLFPAGLHMERSDFFFNKLHGSFDPMAVFCALVIAAIAGLAWMARKGRKEVITGFGWFIVMLLPVSGIVPINSFIAEHWLYLPSIGFFLMASSLLISLFRFSSIRLCVAAFILVIISLLAVLTVRQNYVWRDPVRFYKYTLEFSPFSARIMTNLGVEYFGRGLYAEAEREFKKALAAEPAGTYAYNDYLNLGSALFWQGKKAESLDAFEKAIKLEPGSPLAYYIMANTVYVDGDTKKAIGLYRKAAELGPTNAYHWLMLGTACEKDKDYKGAKEAYLEALEAYPSFVEARLGLGRIYYKQALFKEAFSEYEKAAKLDPENPDAYYYIGNVCAAIGQGEKAREFWEEALKKDPNHAGARKKLGK